jgi:hypothetical protein
VNTRQAALMDTTWSTIFDRDINPLGFRKIFYVSYTDLAFSEKGAEIMAIMEKQNGLASDDTPIIRTIDDLRFLLENGMVMAMPGKSIGDRIAIAPLINDPTNGVVAKDAFLAFPTKDGYKPIEREQMFATQFGCLQKWGSWCKE